MKETCKRDLLITIPEVRTESFRIDGVAACGGCNCVLCYSFIWVPWLIYMCDITPYATYDSLICVIWLTHMCDVTHSCMWHCRRGSGPWWLQLSVTWFIHMSDVTHPCVWRDSSMCVTWLPVCNMIHSYVWHDSLIYVTWLIHICDMVHGEQPVVAARERDVTHSYVRNDSSMCVTGLIRMCDITHPYVWRDSFTCVTWLILLDCKTHSFVRTRLIWSCNGSGPTSGWAGYEGDSISRLFKIIGLFCKRTLQKRPYSAKEIYNVKDPTNRSHPICKHFINAVMIQFFRWD